jgi:hypothetical protein
MSKQYELLNAGVLRMRKPKWFDTRDHLEYKRIGDAYAPWVTLWSPVWLDIARTQGNGSMEQNQGDLWDPLKLYCQQILFHMVDDRQDDWVAYDGPVCQRVEDLHAEPDSRDTPQGHTD